MRLLLKWIGNWNATVLILLCLTFTVFSKGKDNRKYDGGFFVDERIKSQIFEFVPELEEKSKIRFGQPIRIIYQSCQLLVNAKESMGFVDSLKNGFSSSSFYGVLIYVDAIPFVFTLFSNEEGVWNIAGSNPVGFLEHAIDEISTVWPSSKGYHPILIGCSSGFKAFTIPEVKYPNLTLFTSGLPYDTYDSLYRSNPFVRKSKLHKFILQQVKSGQPSMAEQIQIIEKWQEDKSIDRDLKKSEFQNPEELNKTILWLRDYSTGRKVIWSSMF